MNKRYFAAILVLLAAFVFWALLCKKPEPPTPSVLVETQNEQPAQEPHRPPPPPQRGPSSRGTNAPLPASQAQTGSRTAHIVEGVPISEAVVDYVRNSLADPQYDWKQPINFYGKVVDENGAPVPNASINFTWNDLSPQGTSHADTTSDENGLFSLTNRQGKRLSVTASKPGYYSGGDARAASFEYANPADGLFTPDAASPVVFHLRKKGPGADLVTSQSGVKNYLGVPSPSDGTPVMVELLERKSGGQAGQLVISKTTPPYDKWKEATEWSFRMEIPDGGFMEENNEFPFEAPESGYQPAVQFNFQQGQTNWTVMLQKDYYIKFGSPPRYGRLHLETLIEMQGARLTYAINPSGSRNLEPK